MYSSWWLLLSHFSPIGSLSMNTAPPSSPTSLTSLTAPALVQFQLGLFREVVRVPAGNLTYRHAKRLATEIIERKVKETRALLCWRTASMHFILLLYAASPPCEYGRAVRSDFKPVFMFVLIYLELLMDGGAHNRNTSSIYFKPDG